MKLPVILMILYSLCFNVLAANGQSSVQISYYEDHSGSCSMAKLKRLVDSNHFKPINTIDALNVNSTYWLFIKPDILAQQEVNILLTDEWLSKVEVFAYPFSKADQLSGLLVPAHYKSFSGGIVLLKPGSEKYLVRLENRYKALVRTRNLKVVPLDNYLEKQVKTNLFQGIIQGFFWLMFFFNLQLYCLHKKKMHLHYVIYIFLNAFFLLFVFGFSEMYIFKNYALPNLVLLNFQLLGVFFYVMFLRAAMLEYSESYTPKIDRRLLLPYAYIILAVNLIISGFSFNKLHVFDTASNISNCFSTLIGLVLFVFFYRKSNTFLRTIMIGSTVLFVFGYMNVFYDIKHKHTDIFYQTGLLLELVILTFALGKQHFKEQNEAMQSKQQLEKELDSKNRALVFKTAQLSAKDETFGSIKEKLKQEIKNNHKAFEGLFLEGVADKNLWREFAVHFGETHPGFYENLTARYPSLTQNEIRLCAFLKINLNTKEISIITRKSEHSIESMRSRIRHKMGLERSVSMSYILNHVEPHQTIK